MVFQITPKLRNHPVPVLIIENIGSGKVQFHPGNNLLLVLDPSQLLKLFNGMTAQGDRIGLFPAIGKLHINRKMIFWSNRRHTGRYRTGPMEMKFLFRKIDPAKGVGLFSLEFQNLGCRSRWLAGWALPGNGRWAFPLSGAARFGKGRLETKVLYSTSSPQVR